MLLTELLGIDIPLIQAPMVGVSTPKLAAAVSGMSIGAGMDCTAAINPLVSRKQQQGVLRHIESARSEGARVVTGGTPVDSEGFYVRPTVLADVDHSMTVSREEVFGPVLSVIRIKTEDEVIALANETRHGLAAGIFTRDSARSLRVAKAVRAGIVWVNTYRAISPIAEFGGTKTSGYGRESGFQAIYDYTRPKTVWMNTSSTPLASQFAPR